jgi:putative colanic acid biosynthesis glycosyltransferase
MREGVLVRVSVITVVKDDAEGLRRTYQSLEQQSQTDWEMLIVVGDSKDETLNFAQKLQSNDSRVIAIKEVKNGIYAAMNEGLAMASGEYAWFMNAGDIFASSSVLMNAVNLINENEIGVLIGGYQISADRQRKFSYPEGRVSIEDFSFTRRGGCHQSMIFRTQILKTVGGFNLTYSLASDFDLVLRVIRLANARRVSEIYSSISPGGRADQGIFRVHTEKHRIRMTLIGGPKIWVMSLIWTGLARLRIVLRRVLS